MSTTSLASIGNAQLKVIGLNPQGFSRASESRVPGKATFKGMDYQRTGMGEKVTTVEAITYPQVIGGMDAVAWLIRHHEAQDAVPFIRLGTNYLGEVIGFVVVRNLSIDEDRLHPFTGVGRKVEVSAELLHVGSI
jgi:phage protein U